MIRTLITAAAVAVGAAAHAAAPTASLTGPDVFVEYTAAGPVGNGQIDTDDVLYWVHESTGTWHGQSVDSWLIFFDPRLDHVAGTITFPGTIVAVFDDQTELMSTAASESGSLAYDYSNRFVGLEAPNAAATSFAGATMTFRWLASDPGDHIRLYTLAPVPEPAGAALLLAGLALGGAASAQRRRQRQQ
jgi:hypothetical protein